MKRKILQSIANWIISEMEKATTDSHFVNLMEMGHSLDNFCVNYLDVYLD